MKLVTFSVPGPDGRALRLGALLEGDQDGPIVDLTNAYAMHLAAETDEPAQLVAFSSDSETLHPGDVIGTGTVGLGCSMDLHEWPKVGQTFAVEVKGIGSLTHRIVAGDSAVDYVLHGMDGLLPIPPDLGPSPS